MESPRETDSVGFGEVIMFHTPTGNWFLLDETKSNDISLPEFNDSGVSEETANHNESTNGNHSAVENDELNSTFDILPENGSLVSDTSQEMLSIKNLCRIYETMLTQCSELLKSSTKKLKDAEEIQRVNSQNCSKNII
jgi:hypothetical protein